MNERRLPGTITKDMLVADIFDRHPGTRPVFFKFGFHALKNPALRETFGRITTIEKGCALCGIPVDLFLMELNRVFSQKTIMTATRAGNEKKQSSQSILLAQSVDYQVGSIVSRQILAKKAGTLTLFAFDAGQGLSEHTAPFDAAVQIIEGEAEICISGNPSTVSAGEIIILPANQPHAVKALRRFKMLLTMIRS